MNNELLLKADGVKDCVKWLEKKIKEEQKILEKVKTDLQSFGMFEDCRSSYEQEYIKQQAKVETLIDVKISFEKYSKKLKHEAEESN